MHAELSLHNAQRDTDVRAAQQALSAAEAATEAQRARAELAEAARAEAETVSVADKTEATRLQEALRAGQAEMQAAKAERERLEGEMRLVLRAMDQQKQVASRNMAQLSRIYDDWSAAVNA